jgi:mRNA interferase MazF
MKRGEVWIAVLDPIRGSEQAGTRPGIIVQSDSLNDFLRTAVVVPCTTNLRWARFPHCPRLAAGEGGLQKDSVVLGHQVKVVDKTRLQLRIGQVSRIAMISVEESLRLTQDLR